MTAVLSMPTGGRAMLAPQLLKQFKEDFEVARSACRTAATYIEAEDSHAVSGATMRRTSKAAVECGAALKRMHDTESYLDNYASWTALCRALNISKRHSYRLMSCAEALSKVPPQSIGKISTPLSIVPEGIEDDDPPPAQTPASPATDPFAKLRETLQATPRQEIDEAEVPATRTVEHDLSWAKRQAACLLKWFDARSLREAAEPHISALLDLASQAG